jgi:hypothetical protein
MLCKQCHRNAPSPKGNGLCSSCRSTVLRKRKMSAKWKNETGLYTMVKGKEYRWEMGKRIGGEDDA